MKFFPQKKNKNNAIRSRNAPMFNLRLWHRAFCKDFLQVYPCVLRDRWDRMVFTGTGQAPIEVGSQEELIKRVAETRGGIGYIAQKGKGSYERIRTLEIY